MDDPSTLCTLGTLALLALAGCASPGHSQAVGGDTPLVESDAPSDERPYLELLAEQQEQDGRWPAERWAMPDHDPDCPCAASSHALDDAGLTALVLLAYLEGGQTHHLGPQRETIAVGLRFVQRAQERDTGRIGAGALVGRSYGHALATAVLGEALHLSDDPALEEPFLLALRALEAARIPGGVWSASIDGRGTADPYVTAWATSAFAVARERELDIDPRVLPEVTAWLEGQLQGPGGLVAADQPRAATAAVLWARTRSAPPLESPPPERIRSALEALARLQAARASSAFACELDGTLFGSLACFAAGHAPAWRSWGATLEAEVLGLREQLPELPQAGVVALLCASVHFRYARVLLR